MISVARGVHNSLAFCGFLAIAIGAPATSVRAEFPPEGAVSDASNPSVATGDYEDPRHHGVMQHYIFYFDCNKRDWIGVSVAGSAKGQASPPQAVGMGREFPAGPPPGAKREVGNANQATAPGTGQTFVFQRGNWFDAKSGQLMRSPKLCPDSAPQRSDGRSQVPSAARSGQLGPSQPTSHSNPKPDQLPPPPQYLGDPTSRSHR